MRMRSCSVVCFLGLFIIFFSFVGDALSQTNAPKQITGQVVDSTGIGMKGIRIEFLWSPKVSQYSSSPGSMLLPLNTDQSGQFKIGAVPTAALLTPGGVTQFRVTTPLPKDVVLALPNGTLIDPMRTGQFTPLGNLTSVAISAHKLCSNKPSEASLYGLCKNITSIAGACWACNGSNCQEVSCPVGATIGYASQTDSSSAAVIGAERAAAAGATSTWKKCSIVIWSAAWCGPCRALKQAMGCGKDAAGKPISAEDCKKNLEKNYACLEIIFKDFDTDSPPVDITSLPTLVQNDPATGDEVARKNPATKTEIDNISNLKECGCPSLCACFNPKNGAAGCYGAKALKDAGWSDDQLAKQPSCVKPEDCKTYAETSCTPPPTPSPSPSPTPSPSPSATPSASPSPTATATRTPTPRPTATATRTPTPSPTSTATRTPSPSPTITVVPSPTPIRTALRTATGVAEIWNS